MRLGEGSGCRVELRSALCARRQEEGTPPQWAHLEPCAPITAYLFKRFQWIGNQIHWIGSPSGIVFGRAMRYRYKRDLHKKTRVATPKNVDDGKYITHNVTIYLYIHITLRVYVYVTLYVTFVEGYLCWWMGGRCWWGEVYPVSKILFCYRRFICKLTLPLTSRPMIPIGKLLSSLGCRLSLSEPTEVHIRIASVCGLP